MVRAILSQTGTRRSVERTSAIARPRNRRRESPCECNIPQLVLCTNNALTNEVKSCMPTVIRQDTPFLVWRLLHCGLRFFLRLLTSVEVKRLHDDMLESRVLDTSTLNSADNPIGSLWLSTEGLTKRYLAGQVARKHEPSVRQDAHLTTLA